MKITYLKQNNQGNNSLNIISSHRARNIFDRSFSTVTTTIVATTVLMKVKEESKKIGLKLNIQKMKIIPWVQYRPTLIVFSAHLIISSFSFFVLLRGN